MPVNPPYSIIDTIAKLRASGGAAWGDAAASVGKDLGAGAAKGMAGGAAVRAGNAKADAAKYHDATLFADKNFDWQHSPQAGGAPGGAPSSILQPANPATAPGGAPPPPPAAKRPAGSVTMNDIYLAHGLKPVAGGDNIIGTTKAANKADAADSLQDKKTASAEKIAGGKEESAADAAAAKDKDKFDATHMDVDDKLGKLLGLPPGTYPTDFVKSKVGADQRKSTGETAGKAKTDSATIAADAKRDIAEISFRMKSPDHQIQLQAMKDRDAYIIKHPTSAALFGTPADIGKTPGKGGDKPAEKPSGDLDDLDALMVKHGGQ